jgi:hypothetical protein
MNTELEDLVRDTMQQYAADVKIPAGLTELAGRARRRHRQRQLVTRGLVGAGTVTCAAIAVVIGIGSLTATHPGTGTGPKVQTAAYVIGQDEKALAQADAANLVEYVRASGFAGAASNSVTWYNGRQIRVKAFTGAGKLVSDEGISYFPSPRRSIVTDVLYPQRAFHHGSAADNYQEVAPAPGPAQAQKDCKSAWFTGPTIGFPGQPSWAQQIRSVLRCGSYVVAGRQLIDGVQAIKLVSAPRGHYSTIWIDPSTYLPVRIVDFDSAPDSAVTYDFRWLAPTQANLANFNVPIPAGFRQLPLSGSASVFYP